MEYKDIKEIVKDMGESKIDELKIEFPDGTKISMKKNEPKVLDLPEREINPHIEGKENIEKVESKKEDLKYKEIKAPMVGTFYSKSSPTSKAFVKVGDKIKKGDVVCIIEAMKLMNEIETEVSGKVTQICVEDGQSVEYGQVLMYIE